MHRHAKPVRKCNRCVLNFRDSCAIYADPHEQWRRSHGCPDFNSEELLDDFGPHSAPMSACPGKAKRRHAACRSRTEGHRNGDRHVPMGFERQARMSGAVPPR